jgi:SNF2 family DNA or RNA helicase
VPLAEIIQDSHGLDVIGVETQWTEKELIKEVPSSRWNPDLKIWQVPLSWAACLQLRGLFGQNLHVGPQLALWSRREVTERIIPALELREKITRTDGGFWENLYDFQTSGAEFLLTTGEGGLLGDDMGLGKTAQILAALEALLTRLTPEDALPALVICPNSVKSGWAKQAKLWKSTANVYVVEGSATLRRQILAKAREDPLALVVTNIESVRLVSRLAPYGSVRLARCRECSPHGEERLTTARCEVHPKALNGFGFKTVICDEAHALKDPKSKQTRAVWAVGHDPSVIRRWALTGTPVSNNVGDLWALMHFVCPTEYSVKSKFVDRYALQAWNAFGGLDIVGVNPKTRDEFYRILDPRFRRTPKALVLTQLPKVVRPTRWVTMGTKQLKAYREVEERLITRLDTGEVLLAPNNLTKATRLLQLASSYADVKWIPQPLTALSECPCYGAGLNEHAEFCEQALKLQVRLAEPSPKLDAVMEDIDALGGRQAVVAAQSRQLIELLAKRLTKAKKSFTLLTGTVPDYAREQNKQQFITGAAQLMLMTIDAGGTGVDGLQVCDTMLVLQRSWKMLANIQLDARVDRIGSEKHESVTIVDYVTEGTVEETTLYPRLREKWDKLEEINRDRARLVAAGITPEQRFELDKRESALQGSWLGAP